MNYISIKGIKMFLKTKQMFTNDYYNNVLISFVIHSPKAEIAQISINEEM